MTDYQILGDYNIIKQIGQGALGTVFLAEHRFMKKQYVLKVLPQELASDRSFIQRFEEEVAKLSTLSHPNIVKVHNISYSNGLYFLVTDCVVDEMGETTNLAQYMLAMRKRPSEDDTFKLLYQVADALDYAHGIKGAGGVLHLGLKLNNILVSHSKDGPVLHLSDFSLSKIIGTGAVLSRTYKAVAEAIGVNLTQPLGENERYPTPPIDDEKLNPLHASFLQNFAFLAPEQKRLNNFKPVSAKTDNYAFGVLAYYLIMGEFPEGYFDLPSAKVAEYKWNWDQLIISCLHNDPDKRMGLLVPALSAVKETARAPAPKVAAIVQEIPQMESAEEEVQPEIQAIVEEFSIKLPEASPQLEMAFAAPAAQTAQAPRAAAPSQMTPPPSRPATREVQPLRPVFHDRQLERPVTDPDPAAVFNIDTTVKNYVPQKEEAKDIEPLLTDMIVLKGGYFSRGSNDGNRDEMPMHQVSLDSFAIDVHPVTNEQFVLFLEVLGGEKDNNHHDVIRLKDSRIKRSGGRLSIESGYAKHPVVGVTWYGAVAYARWIGKRLPTEAEWEIASKGGNDNAYFPTGEEIDKSQANFFSSDTTAVKSYASNGYGLYDMAGNVYEWCQDWYGYNYYEVSVQEPHNPRGPIQGVYRVLRGGCWKSLREDLCCSRRHRNNPGTVNGTYGFRCAADVQ